MPKKAQTPEYWDEGADQPEWMNQDETIYEEGEPEHIDIIDSEPEDLLNGEGTDRADVIDMTKEQELDMELAKQQQIYDDKIKKQEQKKRISDKKKQIRQLKYAPAYEAGSKIKAGGTKIKKAIDKKRGTPLERQIRKDKMKRQMKKYADVARKKAVSFGKSMKDQKGGKKQTFGGGGFGSGFFEQRGGVQTGGSPRIMNMNIGQKMSKSNLMGNTGTKLMNGKVNLLGNTGQKLMGNSGGMFKKSGSGKPGSKLMGSNILGSATGKNKDNKKRLI